MSIAQFMTFLIMPVGCLLIALLFSWIDRRERRRVRERSAISDDS
jgi:quinol-cytochrome oxidoreductase complex cytochrome b subunit